MIPAAAASAAGAAGETAAGHVLPDVHTTSQAPIVARTCAKPAPSCDDIPMTRRPDQDERTPQRTSGQEVVVGGAVRHQGTAGTKALVGQVRGRNVPGEVGPERRLPSEIAQHVTVSFLLPGCLGSPGSSTPRGRAPARWGFLQPRRAERRAPTFEAGVMTRPSTACRCHPVGGAAGRAGPPLLLGPGRRRNLGEGKRDPMKSPTHYRAKVDHWRSWLDRNPTAKAGHRRSAEQLLAAYLSVLPESEKAFGRLHDVGPREAMPCEAPGCTRTFPPRANRRTCSPACRQALCRSEKAAGTPRGRRSGRPNGRKVVRGGTRQSVTSAAVVA